MSFTSGDRLKLFDGKIAQNVLQIFSFSSTLLVIKREFLKFFACLYMETYAWCSGSRHAESELFDVVHWEEFARNF